MRPINRFLLDHDLRVASNPCVSPDFCLDWPALSAKLLDGGLEAGERVVLHPSDRLADGVRIRN